MEPTGTALGAQNLSIGYPARGRKGGRLYGALSLALRSGELTCLLGPNGAGKSTLLRTLGGLQRPLDGRVTWQGRPLERYGARERSRLLGVVLTDRSQAGGLRVRELVEMGRYPYTGFFGRLDAADRRAADEAIEAVGMTAKADSYVAELSDGERQKAMIAKTLAQQCPVILLDEPTAFLDVASRIEIMELLHRLARLQHKTVLLSTHDVEQALRLSDRIWLLSRAEGFCCGTPEDLVLSGRMDLYFGRGGLFFDRQAGGLRSRQDDAPAVRFEAADEALARWTKNALERNGFRPISDGRDESLPLVRVSALDRIEWYRPGFPSLTCRSFEEWGGGGLCDVAERSGAE